MLGLLLIFISKSWGCHPPGAGHAFPRQRHMCREGVRGYLFLPGFSSLYDAIHGWMTGEMDGWKASRKMTTTSFTICNSVWLQPRTNGLNMAISKKKSMKYGNCGPFFQNHPFHKSQPQSFFFGCQVAKFCHLGHTPTR